MAKYPWSDEPTPLVDDLTGGPDDPLVDADFARDLERRLRVATRLLKRLLDRGSLEDHMGEVKAFVKGTRRE